MKKMFWILSFALLLASCGGDSKSDSGEMNMANFFENYLNTLCEAASKCTSGFVNDENLSYCPKIILNSTEPFEGFHKGESAVFKHKYEMLKNAEEMGWISVDMAQAEVCLSTISNIKPCNPLADVHLLDISECAAVFNGTKTLKQECNQDEECKNGWCNMRGNLCPGTCVDYKPANQSCNTLDKCVPGYECRSSKCAKLTPGDKNEPCINNSDCNISLFCYIKEGDTYGTCLYRQEEGKACTVDDECVVGLSCVNNICNRSRISDTVGAKCGEQPETDENGNNIVIECNRFSKLECGLTNVCQKMASNSNLQCSKFCDTDAGLYCDSSSHTCQWPKTAGLPCTSNEQCASLYCATVSETEDSAVRVCQEPQCLPVNVENE